MATTSWRGRDHRVADSGNPIGGSGIWACVHGDEMALIDTPFPGEDADAMLNLVDGFIARHCVRLRFITTTCLDFDRCSGLTSTLGRYKSANFVFPQSWPAMHRNLSLDRQQFGFQQGLSRQWDAPQHQPYEDTLEAPLAGERLFFVAAPYRSLTDQLVIFRGVALLPRWQLPGTLEEPLPPAGAPEAAVNDTLTRLSEFEARHRYGVPRSIDVSGEELCRDDFQRRVLMGYLRRVKGV